MTNATTTTITWAWGTNTAIDFDPTTDTLDFGWFQADQFTISEVGGSVVISIPSNEQTYTLTGVTLAGLSMSNILARDDTALAEWSSALSHGGSGSAGTGSGTGTGAPSGGGAHTPTTTAITWGWDTHANIDFDPATDKLDFGWFQAGQFTISEVNGSVVISIPSNEQTYTLTGVTLSELSMSNILAKDGTALAEWSDALSHSGSGSGGTGGGGTGTGNPGGGTGSSGDAALWADPWSSTTIYTGGELVSESGIVYQSNWWTHGTDPAGANGPVDSGSPWSIVGHLDTTPKAPDAPAGLFAVDTSDTSTTLVWDAAKVHGAGTVSGYQIFENGRLVATTTDTHYKVAGLSADASYAFTVLAMDEAGTSPQSSPFSVTTGHPGDTGAGAGQEFAPYIDMALDSSQDLLAIARASGTMDFTLAFMLGSGVDQIGWQGHGTIDQDTLAGGSTILAQVGAIQAAGGHITVSFGGAAGQEAALTSSSAQVLTQEYQSVIDRYHLDSIDFDIEGATQTDTAANHMRDQAIVALQAANPGLDVSFTLPVLPTGLVADGLGVLQQAVADGVHVGLVNVMTMDYGDGNSSGDMGQDAIDAARATLGQMHGLGMDAKVGITPMIGINDVTSEVFTLQDAQQVTDFAESNPEVGRIAMWSLGRDNGDHPGQLSSFTSGISQTQYAFSHIFSDF